MTPTRPEVPRVGDGRVAQPGATVARAKPHMAAMGITRLADLTGLDRIGVPVFAAVRPNARSVATSQGKGLTPDAARAAALMEAVESWHAERPPGCLRYASAREMATYPLVDLARLPRSGGRAFDPDRPILWGEGLNLGSGEPRWLPFELVHTDYRLPQPPAAGCFPVGSNGLGAGNSRGEAIRHALLELIERDALSLWLQRPDRGRGWCRIAPESDPVLNELAGRLGEAGFDLAIVDITSDLAVPAFLAVLADRRDPAGHAGFGSAAHPAAGVAASKALLEAVQVRTSYIAGARDDLGPDEFAAGGLRAKARWAEKTLQEPVAGPLRPDAAAAALAVDEQIPWLLHRLAANGIPEAIAVDLGRPEIGIPVLRVVVPGLEAAADEPGYVPGARALAVRSGR
ncbi:MAG: YcaO-like family protein [Geminicoccaceae bacterium]